MTGGRRSGQPVARATLRPVLATLALVSFACSGSPEQTLLEQFFRALGQEDRNTFAGLSMVSFPGDPPASWELLEVSEPTSGPYRVPQLLDEEREATRLRDEQFQVFSSFRSANQASIRAIAERREVRPEGSLGGRLAAIEEEWETHQGDRTEVRRALAEVQMALEEERRRARRSLLRDAPVDYLEGTVTEKELRVRVNGEQDYRFVLIRYDLTNQFGNAIASRWVVAAIESVDAGESPPPVPGAGPG